MEITLDKCSLFKENNEHFEYYLFKCPYCKIHNRIYTNQIKKECLKCGADIIIVENKIVIKSKLNQL